MSENKIKISEEIEDDIARYTQLIKRGYVIDKSLYEKYNIKQGLRNSNDTGVKIGITKIAEVKGYEIQNDKKVAVDGELFYRGYSIKDLLRKMYKEEGYYFERISYLLLVGHLPSKDELNKFLENSREIRKQNIDFFIRKIESHEIMNALQRGVLYLYSFDENADEITIRNLVRQSIFINSVFPHILAQSFLNEKLDMFLHYSLIDSGASISEYILKMVKDKDVLKKEVEILDLLLSVHAEHGGGNNSTFSLRVTSSAYTDTYSSISAAIGSLKGQRHGGANSMALKMVRDMKKNINVKSKDEIKMYLRRIIKKEEFDRTGLIYGLGHAIYTKSDPRAEILKEKARELAIEKNNYEEFELYENIEIIGKEVFKELKGENFIISANLDLYSGYVYDSLGLPEELFTPLFALARIPSWCAHRIEQIYNEKKIIRPAYVTVK